MGITIALGILAALAAFVGWRYTSVARGARKRDDELLQRLDPIAERLENKKPVSQEEVAGLTRVPELRPMVHQLLSHYERLDLFPRECLARQAEAEGILVYWLRHPTELQGSPAAIQYLETVHHAFHGKPADFFVFKYRMPDGHWAGQDWILGLAGPFRHEEKPYESAAGGFSRAGDIVGKVKPQDLVTWCAGMLQQKFGADR